MNITIIVIILIGVIAAAGAILIPRLANNAMYSSCCTQAGGTWNGGYCSANTPITCDSRENVWNEYNSCVKESGKNNANEKYKTVTCS